YLAVAAFLSLIPFLARPAIAAWPLGGLAIDSGPFVTDNAGGFWVGSRTAQHIDGTPTILAGGVPCLPSGNFAASDAAPDGSGGVVLALVASGDIFAGRVISIGSVMWGSSGVIVCNAA